MRRLRSVDSPVTAQRDLSAATRVPFARLVAVELRKARDTRAGFWLLVGIALIVILMTGTATVITLVQSDRVLLGDFMSIAAYMTSFLPADPGDHAGDQRVEPTHGPGDVHPRTAPVAGGAGEAGRRPVFTLLTLVVSLVVGMVCAAICERLLVGELGQADVERVVHEVVDGVETGSAGQVSRGSSPGSGQKKFGDASAGVSAIWSPPLYAGLSVHPPWKVWKSSSQWPTSWVSVSPSS